MCLFLLKSSVAPGGRKHVEYFALGLTLKASLGMNHATRTSANMKYRITKFSVICLLLLRSPFVRKSVFYSKKIQYVYNFYGIDLYVNVCRGEFRTQSNIYGRTTCNNHKKALLKMFDFWIGFTVEKVYRMTIFIWYG